MAELVRCIANTRSLDWPAWFRHRLADKTLSERRRRTLGTMLMGICIQRADPHLALDSWVNGRDLWASGAKTATIAILACEAALWLKKEEIFLEAFSIGKPLFPDSTRSRLEFLREAYVSGQPIKAPRDIHLPSALPHDALLPFVDYYARARVADAEGRFDIALDYYTKALRTLPVSHEAYNISRTRDYEIRNNKIGQTNQALDAIPPKRST